MLQGLDFIREKVRARDNHTCQLCGKQWVAGTRRLDVHHLNVEMESIKDYEYDRTHLYELITLCHKCHLGLPHNRDKMSVAQSHLVKEETIQRRQRVYEMRGKRMSFKAIGQVFGLTRQRAHQIYQEYLSTDSHLT